MFCGHMLLQDSDTDVSLFFSPLTFFSFASLRL